MCSQSSNVNGQNLLFVRSQDQLEKEGREIEAVFMAAIDIMEKAKARALQPLKDRRQAVETEAKGIVDKLEEEINLLEKTVSGLDDVSGSEDHIFFLQVRGSVSGLDPALG